ncbi:MAG: TnsA endonuclease N-terminal domain-containing protein, partial [Candidatus Hydrogenedentes bacterium]|nr:TnsA endonuclease N-terminal domain-containing protein [Candidatus Hydrogenedentota bacterium]
GGLTAILKGKANRFIANHHVKTPEARSAQSARASAQLRNSMPSPFDGIGRSIRGTHFSLKLLREVGFMSLYEKNAFEILDAMDSVTSYLEQPFTIPYMYKERKFTYVPDILVHTVDGKRHLVEVKPQAMLSSPRVQAKHLAAQTFCRQNGMSFIVLMEDDLFRKETITLG